MTLDGAGGGTGRDDPQTYAIIGAAMTVHATLGCGFLEAVYQEALALEMCARSIPNDRERCFEILYRGAALKTFYRADFVCFDAIIVELKATQHLSSCDERQAINYLRASGLSRALVLNFGTTSLEFKRVILSPQPDAIPSCPLNRS